MIGALELVSNVVLEGCVMVVWDVLTAVLDPSEGDIPVAVWVGVCEVVVSVSLGAGWRRTLAAMLPATTISASPATSAAVAKRRSVAAFIG